jgi:hypothetical protein
LRVAAERVFCEAHAAAHGVRKKALHHAFLHVFAGAAAGVPLVRTLLRRNPDVGIEGSLVWRSMSRARTGWATWGAACAALPLLVGCPAAAPVAPVAPAAPAATPSPNARLLAAASRDPSCGSDAYGSEASLLLDRARLRANGATPALLAKLDTSAHRYARLLAVETAARTCFAFRDVRWHLPVVAIHGDAHVEQLVVTPRTFGLEDFDQAGFGPAVVDLVRFASSLHLMCRETKWQCRPDDAVAAFFRAYRDALDHAPKRTLPSVVERVRSRLPHDTAAWLAWADSLTQPLAPAQEQATKARWADFIKLLTDTQADRARAYYDIVRVGSLRMGLGSALETKLLFRVRGETDAPTDDVILEARVASQPASTSCVWRPSHGGSLHTLMFMSLLGPRLPQVFGTVVLDDAPGAPEFWLQAWEPGYYELPIGDIASQSELEELAIDAARQLAGYFWTHFPEPLRVHQRYVQLRAFDIVDLRARALAKVIAMDTVTAWEQFRAVK